MYTSMHTQFKHLKTASILAVALASLASGLANAGEIRVMCYQDGNECDVTADLAKRFEAANPSTKVIVDTVPYKTIVEQLPVQLAAGQGPDIARVADLGGMAKYYIDISAHLKDKAAWEKNFGGTQSWLRPWGDKGIYGMQTQLTVTGPFVNKTLFAQAGVPLPGPKATWDDWVAAANKVAKATQTPAAMAWDRSGHRFAGPAISYGAKIFDDKGELVIDEGYKNTVRKFVGWHKDGTMSREVWAGAGGSTYRDAFEEFKNARIVMYLSGSWQIGRMDKEIGKTFDWAAVPNPCGTTACSGIPGGSAFVALKTTKSPKEVGAFLDFMAQDANYSEFAARTGNIPAHIGVAQKGVSYTSASPAGKAALAVFGGEVAKLDTAAFQFQGYRFNRAIMLPTVARVSQAIVGELSVDESLSKLAVDMSDAVKAAQK